MYFYTISYIASGCLELLDKILDNEFVSLFNLCKNNTIRNGMIIKRFRRNNYGKWKSTYSTRENFDQEVVNSSNTVLVDFWARGGPCRAVGL